MSIWITIILGLIQNLPLIISAIKEIIALLRNKPAAVQAQAKSDLKSAISDCIKARQAGLPVDHGLLLSRLENIIARLKQQ
jgi:hypothetical protein